VFQQSSTARSAINWLSSVLLLVLALPAQAALNIAPATLPVMSAGVPYSQPIVASGGTEPYTYTITASSLPSGLALDDGTLIGTPTSGGPYALTVTARDALGTTGSRTYSGTIVGGTPIASDVSATLAYGSSANPITPALSGAAATSVAVVSGAMHGTATSNGTSISYTPAAGYAGPDSFTYTASNGSGTSAPAKVSVTVGYPPIMATSSNPLTATGGQPYTQTLTWSGGAAPYSSYAVSGLPTGLSITATDANSLTISGTPTAAGSFLLTASASDSSTGIGPFHASQSFTLTVSAQPLVLSPGPTIYSAMQGNGFTRVFSASGGTAPYTFIQTGSLPAGMTWNGATATLAGTLSESGSFAFNIQVIDSSGTPATITQGYTLQVFKTLAVTAISPTSGPAAGGTSVIITGSNLNGATAVRFGATAASSFTVNSPTQITATAPAGTGTVDVTVTTADGTSATTAAGRFTYEAPAPLGITPATVSDGTAGSAYSITLRATGGTAPYRYVAAGALPTGLTLDAATGVISGTPSPGDSGSTFNFTVTATDWHGVTGTQAYALAINAQVPVAPSLTIHNAIPGQPVELDLTRNATGGPFVAANLLSVSPASSGSASIRATGAGYVLRFVPHPDAVGVTSLTYTLSNASSTSNAGVISIALASRSDPSKDPEVQGLLNAQANSSRRFANGQISNFQQRLEALHAGNVSTFSNGLNLSSSSLQRRRLDDDPTGIEQWLQIQTAKLQAESSLRASLVNEQPPALGNQPDNGPTSPVAIWTSGTISMGDDDSGSQEFVTSGLSVGADYRWAPDLTLGLGFGYGHDKTDVGDNGSRSQADSYSVALYGSYRPTENTYVDAVLGYQRLTFDSRRYVTDTGGLVTGDRDGSQAFASLAVGYEHRQEHWLLSPYARLDMTHATLDSYRENGDAVFALVYEQQTVKTTSTNLGLRGEYAYVTASGEFTPSLRLEYQHDVQATGDARMRYADLSGGIYRSNLDAQGQDRGVVGLGLGLRTESDWSLRLEYQFTISSGSQQAQSMLFNLEKPF